MGELCYSVVASESELQNFDCGNSSINSLVESSYFRHMLRQSLTFKVSVKGHRVGFYTISILGISLNNSDSPVAQYYEKTPSFGAIKLDYIAVDKRVHKQGIGTDILVYIIKCAQILHQKWPVRILILDALRQRVDWYLAHGFEPINKADLSGSSETVGMFLDLMPKEKRLLIEASIDDYCNIHYSW